MNDRTAKKATKVLDRLLARVVRDERLLELLSDFDDGYTQGWYMCLPDAFKAPLDIRQTARVVNKQQTIQWTQGANFCFKEGDTIYDSSNAYDEWGKALQQMKLCVCVTRGTAAGSIETDGAQKGSRQREGMVTFDILRPNKGKTALEKVGEHTCTQGEFVRFLIEGPPASWPNCLQK